MEILKLLRKSNVVFLNGKTIKDRHNPAQVDLTDKMLKEINDKHYKVVLDDGVLTITTK